MKIKIHEIKMTDDNYSGVRIVYKDRKEALKFLPTYEKSIGLIVTVLIINRHAAVKLSFYKHGTPGEVTDFLKHIKRNIRKQMRAGWGYSVKYLEVDGNIKLKDGEKC